MVTKEQQLIKQLSTPQVQKFTPVSNGMFLPNHSGMDTGIPKIKVNDHDADGTRPQVVNVVYGTGDPPTASTTPIGTLWVKYTA